MGVRIRGQCSGSISVTVGNRGVVRIHDLWIYVVSVTVGEKGAV